VTDSGGVRGRRPYIAVHASRCGPTPSGPSRSTRARTRYWETIQPPIASIRPLLLERRPAEIDGWDGDAGERVPDVIVSSYLRMATEAYA
jgi:hypothetical protein